MAAKGLRRWPQKQKENEEREKEMVVLGSVCKGQVPLVLDSTMVVGFCCRVFAEVFGCALFCSGTVPPSLAIDPNNHTVHYTTFVCSQK